MATFRGKLLAAIGGAAYGLIGFEREGMACDAMRQRVGRRNSKCLQNFWRSAGDVTNPIADIFAGAFPCQIWGSASNFPHFFPSEEFRTYMYSHRSRNDDSMTSCKTQPNSDGCLWCLYLAALIVIMGPPNSSNGGAMTSWYANHAYSSYKQGRHKATYAVYSRPAIGVSSKFI